MFALFNHKTISHLFARGVIRNLVLNQSWILLQTIRSNVECHIVNFIVNWTPRIGVTATDLGHWKSNAKRKDYDRVLIGHSLYVRCP